MNVECLHRIEDVAPLRDAINALNLKARVPDPFSTFEYLKVLCETQREPGELWFLTASVNSQLVGYLPLELSVRPGSLGSLKRLHCLAGHEGDRPHVVAAREHEARVVAAFYAYLLDRPGWNLLELEQQDVDSMLFPPPPGMKLRGAVAKAWPDWSNYTIPIRWRSLHDYWRSLAKKFRSEVKRGMCRLFTAGRLELLSARDASSAAALIELYYSIEARSWKRNADLSVHGDAIRKSRLHALMSPDQPMRISIHILLLDGVPIAGLVNGAFSHSFGSDLYALHIVFDERYRSLSPGSAILMLGIREAIEGGFALYNLLAGFGHYKTRWLAEATELRSAQIYRVGSAPFWQRSLGDARRWFMERLPLRATSPVSDDRTEEHEPARTSPQGLPVPTREELTQYSAMVAAAIQGACEHLSSDRLAAVLPFGLNDSRPVERAPRPIVAKSGRSARDASLPNLH